MIQFGQVVQQLDFEAIPSSTIQLDLQQAKAGLHFLTIIVDSEQAITEKILIN